MNSIIVKSPAKINLGLNILRKRADGFHDLETIFYPLKLSDTITFKKSNKTTFTTDDEILNSEKSNLIIKAKEELENYTSKEFSVEIVLNKNIPLGAGLGGGSSNAAFTLTALNELFNLNISFDQLRKIALELGSDVPFFINPVPSFAESRGEILKPLKISFEFSILIVNPKIHISTQWAFKKIKPRIPKKSLKQLAKKESISLEDLIQCATNDFEEIVFPAHPEIGKVKKQLDEIGSLFSMMSGTGSTIFGFFENKKVAEKAASKFPKHYLTHID